MQRVPDPSQHHLCLLQLMRPNPNYSPSKPTQSLVDPPITPLVLPYFRVPEVLIRHRASVAPRTAMPKTTVYKNRNFFTPEHEIGCARKLWVPTPA